MSSLNEEEIKKISVMYEGDKDRDASSKIRGFLFQDYIAINCLLQEGVEYVCSEYLEDVDVFFTDGSFEFIQVKYYPRTEPKKEEICTDLYYQFLRLNVLQSGLLAKPRLYIHREKTVNKPTVEEMVKYVTEYADLPVTVDDFSKEDRSDWLKNNVNTKKTKKDQKISLFSKVASENSIREFVNKYDIVHKKDISLYKSDLMEELVTAYPNSLEKVGVDEEKWPSILLGLAISYIQKRYLKDSPSFEELRVGKKEFNDYINSYTGQISDQYISSYLVDIICEKYGDIITNNDLNDLQIKMLNQIYKNTIRWIDELCIGLEGQYRLLNTISLYKVDVLDKYKELLPCKRLDMFKESKDGFCVFLSYMWKIMLDICHENVTDESIIPKKSELFIPSNYMENNVTDYVCFDFTKYKSSKYSIILPGGGQTPKRVLRIIMERVLSMSQIPEKLFFENSDFKKKELYYDYSSFHIGDVYTVADGKINSLCIECMHCIKIDDGDWSENETCSDCIFSINCVDEGRVQL